MARSPDVYLVEMAGQQVYELEGTDAKGAEIAVYVSSDGEVVKAEKDAEEKDGEEAKSKGRKARGRKRVREAGRYPGSQAWRMPPLDDMSADFECATPASAEMFNRRRASVQMRYDPPASPHSVGRTRRLTMNRFVVTLAALAGMTPVVSPVSGARG